MLTNALMGEFVVAFCLNILWLRFYSTLGY